MSADPELLPAQPAPTHSSSGWRNRVYLRPVNGRLFRARRIVAWLLLVLYVALPHIQIGDMPAILLDIPARRFSFFGTLFFATDTLLLALLLIGVAVSIIAITALFGRLWCGWACPQTVYLEFVFRPIEQWLEGSWHMQRAFDRAPWTAGKIIRKSLKWLMFSIIATILANTFLAYFVGVETLEHWMGQSPLEQPFPFLVMGGLSVAMLVDFGWFREQMCNIACPYGRIQAAMLDENTLRVAYDTARGEPRGKLQRGELQPGQVKHGDCVNCRLCVQVCPTGIDIRDGTQLECIGCTRCIDACNETMAKLQRPPGLIRHTSAAALAGARTRWLTPRIMGYALLLTIIAGALSFTLGTRSEMRVAVLRAVGEPYHEMADGRVSNHFKVRVTNRSEQNRSFSIRLLEPADAKLVTPLTSLELKGFDIGTLDAFVLLPSSELQRGRKDIRILVENGEGAKEELTLTFVGPHRVGGS